MSFRWEALGDSVENVLSWLDNKDLGQIEASHNGVCDQIMRRCWEALAAMELDACASRPRSLQPLLDVTTVTGKMMLKELFDLRVALSSVPANCAQRIHRVGPSSLHLLPKWPWECTEDVVSGMSPWAPRAAIPLALGTYVGDEMCVGLHIQSNAQCAHDGVWLSADFIGVHGGLSDCMSVHCAPLSGRCIITFSGDHSHSLDVQIMHSLVSNLCESVELYVAVSKFGDVEFFRVCERVSSIERSGKIPCAPFTRWTKDTAVEVFTAVEVEMLNVPCETWVSVKRPDSHLLYELKNQPELVCDAIWIPR